MRRKSFDDAACPVARALDEIGEWWTLLIVRESFQGARRFGDFQRSLGLAKNVLSSRLSKMVGDGILELRPAASGGMHKEYHLTKKGMRLRVVLVALRQWGEENLYAPGEPMLVMVDKQTEEPIRRLQLTAKDGRALDALDVTFKGGRAPGDSKLGMSNLRQ